MISANQDKPLFFQGKWWFISEDREYFWDVTKTDPKIKFNNYLQRYFPNPWKPWTNEFQSEYDYQMEHP